MKIADVLLEWDKSVSLDIDYHEITITVNGVEQKVTVSNEVTSTQIAIEANSNVIVQARTVDKEGKEVLSVVYNFSVGDLEAPQPLTNFRHSIIGIRESDDTTPDEDTF